MTDPRRRADHDAYPWGAATPAHVMPCGCHFGARGAPVHRPETFTSSLTLTNLVLRKPAWWA